MSIEGNLGMSWIASELSSTGATSGMQNLDKVVLGNPEDSIFQKLINQMLMQNNITTTASGTSSNNGEKTESGSISDLVSGLLVGGNLSKGKLHNIMSELGKTSETPVNTGSEEATDENGVSLEMIQALMIGMTNGSSLTNNEKKIDPEIQNSTNQTSSIISVAQSAGNELRILGNQRFILNNNNQENSLEEASVIASSKIEPKELSVIGSNVNSANLNEADSNEPKNPKQLNGKLEKQDILPQSDYQSSKIGSKKQTVLMDSNPMDSKSMDSTMMDSKSVEGIVESVAKMKPESVSEEQIRLEYQTPLQSNGPISETAALNPLKQPAEKVEPYTQITDEILTKLEQKGPTEFKMQLEPENLGQIDIKLKLNDGKLVIDIIAANSKTQELLTGQVDKLISSMGLQNVKVESVQVNQQMNSQSQDSQSQGQGYTMNSGMDFSQRKQQEHFQQEAFKGRNLEGAIKSKQNETQAVELTTRTEPLRYDSHRMNYAV